MDVAAVDLAVVVADLAVAAANVVANVVAGKY